MASRREAALALSFFLGETGRPLRPPPAELAPEEIWRGSNRAIARKLGLGPREQLLLAEFRRTFSPAAAGERLAAAGIGYLARGESGYPPRLETITGPPAGLFVRAARQPAATARRLLERPCVAVVGSRSASRYGLDAAVSLARDLSRSGICIVSGMALGVDAAAHRGGLEGAGGSIAVLGCGADVVYPARHRALYRELVDGGAIISEYPPGTPARPWRFPARNRIIAGICRAVVVVEARRRSGALITAEFCLEQGGEVCAVPGSIFSELSRGPNNLIREGAVPVTGAGDVLQLLGMEEQPPAAARPAELSRQERQLLAALDGDTLTPDQLAAATGIPPAEIPALLLSLELEGLVRLEPGSGYGRVPGLSRGD